jgi:hypothetical protein
MSAERFDIDAIGTKGAELARYETSAGERVVMGWRHSAGIEVTDRPLHGRARGYVVDRGFRSAGQLAAFVGDYLSQARLLDACPMGTEQVDALLAGAVGSELAPLLAEET